MNMPVITSSAIARRAFTMIELLIVIGLIAMLVGLTATVTLGLRSRSEIKETENVLRLLDMAVSEWEAASDRKLSWGEVGDYADGSYYDMDNGTPHVFTVPEMLRTIGRSSPVRTIINQIGDNFIHEYNYDSDDPWTPPWLVLYDNPDEWDPNKGTALSDYQDGDWNGTMAVLDSWGTPIRAIHPGRIASTDFNDNPADFRKPDPGYQNGTVNLDNTVYIDTGTHNTIQFYGVEEIHGMAVKRQICFVSAGPDGKFGNISFAVGTDEYEWTRDNLYSYPPEDPVMDR